MFPAITVVGTGLIPADDLDAVLHPDSKRRQE
jgi:hypothetical protein